ncbi:MAG TPA: lysophospholipid acyltransferase family protein [Candidatus Omnitrophota bacterium]|nr:lysophospholipid acyltransferase family protein [Candidatus Omnitrophota bacterium]
MGRRRPFRRTRQRLELLLLRAAGRYARSVSFERASDTGAAAGALAARLLARRRRVAEENLRRALGERPAGSTPEALAREAFRQLGRSFFEFLALPAQEPGDLLARIEFVGWEPILARAREGKGGIMVTAHFGNWELLGAAFGLLSGGRVKYLLPAQTNEGSDRYLNEVRRKLGIEPLTIGYGMRSGLRALREGSFLGMLPDQDARKAGIHVPFFGRPASTHTGPARLAARTGAPIGVAVIERTGRGRFRARLRRVLVPDPRASEEAEVERLTREMTAEIEAAIRELPGHWYWIHRRWKTPPPDRSADPATAPAATTPATT